MLWPYPRQTPQAWASASRLESHRREGRHLRGLELRLLHQLVLDLDLGRQVHQGELYDVFVDWQLAQLRRGAAYDDEFAGLRGEGGLAELGRRLASLRLGGVGVERAIKG